MAHRSYSLPNPPLYIVTFIKMIASQPTHIFIRNRFGRSHKTRISPSPDNFRYPTVCSFIYWFLHLLLIIFTFFYASFTNHSGKPGVHAEGNEGKQLLRPIFGRMTLAKTFLDFVLLLTFF